MQVLRKGEGISTRPTPQSRVKVRSRGCLESGEVVDKHSGYWFTVGDGDVVQGRVSDLVPDRVVDVETCCSLGHCCYPNGAQ